MLTLITNTELDLTQEDPVRPHIPMSWRSQHEIWAWVENSQRLATVCVAWLDTVPDSEQVMLITPRGDLAVAYTIWSTQAGAGQQLIRAVQAQVQNRAQGMYTLSPTTEMARRFHVRNGATVYRINADTVNYEYQLATRRATEQAETSTA